MTTGSRRAAAMAALCILALSLGLASASFGQQISAKERDQQVRLAKDLAKADNYDGALRSLENLYEKLPEDGIVVRALFDLLVRADRYGRAEEVITRYLEGRSGDIKARSDLAALYFKTDRKDEGMTVLEGLIEMAPDEAWPYDIGLNVLVGSDLGEDALGLILQARQAMGDSTIFARDASRIHSGAGRHRQATREQLRSAIGRDRNAEAEAERIIAAANKEEARSGVISALEHAKDIEAFKPAVRRALWEVYLIAGDCAMALEELSGVVKEVESSWRYCPVLAGRAAGVGCYDECRQAYALAARYADDPGKVPVFLIGKGQCEVDAGLVEQALETYNRVAEKYPHSQWSAKAAVERATIYRSLGRLDEAAVEADRVIADDRAGDARYEAILFKADCLVEVGRLDEAFETYDLVGEAWKPGYAQEAFFNLGEVSFYRGDFEGAVSYYNVALRQFLDERRANDAVERLLLIKGARIGEAYAPDLNDLAQASLLRRQGNFEDAEAAFDRLTGGTGEIKVESLENLSEMYLEQGAFEEAIRTYKVIGESLDTRRSAAALEAAGDVYLSLGRTDEAVRTYEDVILRFPTSVAAGEARRKIELTRRQEQEGS